MQRKIFIGSKEYLIEGDADYLGSIKEHFEPETIAVFKSFCQNNFQILDLGANIGLTAIGLADICTHGKVAAIEPVTPTFAMLKKNLLHSNMDNVKAYNFAVGNKEGTAIMEASDSFLAGAFIADVHQSQAQELSEKVLVKRLDDTFDLFNMDRVDFMKIDVEGYELFALEGAKKILDRFKPIVYLEMNHWCLNIMQRITLPEFRERLLAFFPYVFAIEDSSYLDFTSASNFHYIAHEHLVKFKYLNLIAGFDKTKLLENLLKLQDRTVLV
jgi:FkbM family methyltransferase